MGQFDLEAEAALALNSEELWMNWQKYYELRTSAPSWTKICREVRLHPIDRKTGALKVPKVKG